MEVVTVKDEWSTEFFLQIAKDVLLMGVLKFYVRVFLLILLMAVLSLHYIPPELNFEP